MISAMRPKLELLNQEFIEKIVDEAFILLERQGIFVENTQAIELFKEAGMRVDESTQTHGPGSRVSVVPSATMAYYDG
jgi:trimethylamine--corrinoid protein Co-methyltransferase